MERLIQYLCHTLLPISRCGVMHCHPETQQLIEVYEIYPKLTGEVLAHDIHIIFLVHGSRNLQEMTKMTFSSLLFVLEFIVRNITAFHSGCWYIATQCLLPLPLYKRAVLNWFLCAIKALGTYAGPVWNKEATQNGLGPCWSRFHGNEEWHLLQQLWCNTNWQLSYNEKKQLHLMRQFGHL